MRAARRDRYGLLPPVSGRSRPRVSHEAREMIRCADRSPDRRARRTMNPRRFTTVISRLHQLRYLRPGDAERAWDGDPSIDVVLPPERDSYGLWSRAGWTAAFSARRAKATPRPADVQRAGLDPRSAARRPAPDRCRRCSWTRERYADPDAAFGERVGPRRTSDLRHWSRFFTPTKVLFSARSTP